MSKRVKLRCNGKVTGPYEFYMPCENPGYIRFEEYIAHISLLESLGIEIIEVPEKVEFELYVSEGMDTFMHTGLSRFQGQKVRVTVEAVEDE